MGNRRGSRRKWSSFFWLYKCNSNYLIYSFVGSSLNCGCKQYLSSTWLKSYQPQLKGKERVSAVVLVWFVACFQKDSGKAMRWEWKSWQLLMISFNSSKDTQQWPFVPRFCFCAFTTKPWCKPSFRAPVCSYIHLQLYTWQQAGTQWPATCEISSKRSDQVSLPPSSFLPWAKNPDEAVRPELYHAS